MKMAEIIPKTFKEAENLLFHIFMQGDTRHFDSFYLKLLVEFITENAIQIQREVFSLESKNESGISGPQKKEKQKAVQILNIKKAEIEGFEMPFLNYRADILARDGKKQIVVECGPCRLWKAIFCLGAGADLWVIREEEQTELFIITKGRNWDRKFNEFRSRETEELKKIKNPLDEL